MPGDAPTAATKDIERFFPKKPSGYRGECRSALAMADNASSIGTAALVPPVAGLAYAALNGALAAAQQFTQGHIGKGLGAMAAAFPAMGAGFFGGGVAADAVQGGTNETLERAAGIDAGTLPGSHIQDAAKDASCFNAPAVKPLTQRGPSPSGATAKPSKVTPSRKAHLKKSAAPKTP